MKLFIRVYDFIKSWLYYPKMKRFLNGIECEPTRSRLKYALWHCKNGMCSDTAIENEVTTYQSVSGSWKRVYDREPIEK